MFILDTNTLIYFFKDQGRVATNLLQQSPKDISVPAIVVYELEVGIRKSSSPDKRTKQLAALLALVAILPFGKDEAKFAAQIRADLETQGQLIGPYDILIAATALANQGTLVTRNLKEFQRIAQLKLADWF